ncbi:MAG: hypothetical protein RLZZ196_517 [Bacteroidota bacterium]|jgi:hypothetical protein
MEVDEFGYKYYIYYDKKTGSILSVTNSFNDNYEHYLEVSFDDAKGFLSGKQQFKDYQVGYQKDSGKPTVLSLINEFSGYTFNNKIFEWIDQTDKDAECIVEWNLRDKVWNFSLSPGFKNTYNSIVSTRLVFFVTLENDPDFLIRTIFINSQDLLGSNVFTVPFESKFEYNIDKISISSKLVFNSYKLKVIHE